MEIDYIGKFVAIMRKHERKWKNYYIENGVLYFETQGGIVMNAKTPEELEEKLMRIGDHVKFVRDGKTLEGEIANIYAVPKDYDLVDIVVDGETYYGISTEDIMQLKND